jgi:hypothetical protein
MLITVTEIISDNTPHAHVGGSPADATWTKACGAEQGRAGQKPQFESYLPALFGASIWLLLAVSLRYERMTPLWMKRTASLPGLLMASWL